MVAFLVVSKVAGRFSYGVSDLVNFDFSQVTPSLVAEIWNLAKVEMGDGYKGSAAKRSLFVAACCTKAASNYGIADVAVVGRRTVPNHQSSERIDKIARQNTRKEEKILLRDISEDVVSRVDAALPPQPWKPGIHHEIAGKLGLDPRDVSASIGRLIRSGRRNHQRDGVVFGSGGQVIAVDPDRAKVKEADVSGQAVSGHLT